MWQLCVPWLLAASLTISILLLFFKRLRWLSLGLVAVVLLLNYWYEVVTLNLSARQENNGILKVMTWNIAGSSPKILDNINKNQPED